MNIIDTIAAWQWLPVSLAALTLLVAVVVVWLGRRRRAASFLTARLIRELQERVAVLETEAKPYPERTLPEGYRPEMTNVAIDGPTRDASGIERIVISRETEYTKRGAMRGTSPTPQQDKRR